MRALGGSTRRPMHDENGNSRRGGHGRGIFRERRRSGAQALSLVFAPMKLLADGVGDGGRLPIATTSRVYEGHVM